jgi:hypothetical protein
MARPAVNDPKSRASRFRRARFRMIEEIIGRIVARKGRARILDIGGRRDYWALLDPALASRVSLLLLNYDDELEVGRAEGDGLDVSYATGDGCAMPQYGDRSFDLAHSNSVIEHVGSLQNCARFADEVRRVAEAYYVQTPYLWFPIEPHYGVPFLHWLPSATRAQLYARYKIGYAARMPSYRAALARADHVNLVDRRLMRELFPDGRLIRERFALMTKSIVMVREADA